MMNKTKSATFQPGDLFQLIGMRLTFRVHSTFLAAGTWPCVTGITLDGKRYTNALVEDVVRVAA